MSDSSPILILTAGFGDGHNSAARSIAEAVSQASEGRVQPVVVDLFEDAAPLTGAFYKWCYRQMITYLPGLWAWLFRKTQTEDFSALWWDRWVGVGRALEARLRRHQPAVLMLTYPVYPYFLAALPAGVPRPRQVLMAVTDSITIHPIWLQGVVDRLFVTDEISAEVARRGLTHAVPVEVTGFPVAPGLAEVPVRREGFDPARLRVLYFATTTQRQVRRTLHGLLEAMPRGTQFSIVLGRHAERLGPVIQELKEAFPQAAVTTIGWTREVPRLLMEHDVVISKAGGATVHECFAAGIPVVVNYIIPGQEEGNAQLLERLGGGCRSLVPEETGPLLAALVSDGRLAAMQRAMASARRPDGALRIGGKLLALLEP